MKPKAKKELHYIRYSIYLRPFLNTNFYLPSDISQKEINMFVEYIKSISTLSKKGKQL